MSHRIPVGVLGTAHMHCWSYVSILKSSQTAEMIGFYEPDEELAKKFADDTGTRRFADMDELLAKTEAISVCSENAFHQDYAVKALNAGKHVLCEKPIAVTEADAQAMIDAARRNGVSLMIAFPCRFSPAYQGFKKKVKDGAIGKLFALRTTNRGRCPFGWFVEKEKSGGGAMIDHTVHVADLLFDLLGEEPSAVEAKTGSLTYGQPWEDTAMLTLDFPSGVFATLDSSWSRPQNYKTWGDVTLEAVGENGIVRADLFGEGLEVCSSKSRLSGWGADLDRMMVDEFISAILEKRDPIVTGEHGLAALRVALKGYASLA